MASPITIVKKAIRFYSVPLTQLYAYQNARCFYCNCYMKFHTYHPENVDRQYGFTIDHLFPRSMGYTKVGNSVLSCRHCNEKKGNRIPTTKEILKAWNLYQQLGKEFIATIILT